MSRSEGRGRVLRASVVRRRAAAALLTVAILGGCAGERRPARHSLARNFVLLCFDTVRADTFARGDRPGAADGFSAWSRRAVVYDDARTPAPWTLPAVASVMTGLYPARHGAGRFGDRVADLETLVPSRLPAWEPVLGQAASQAGFETAAFISNPWVDIGSGVLRGFQRVERHPTASLLEPARAWLTKRRSSAPFFLYVHWVDAHGEAKPKEKLAEVAALSPDERRELIASAPGGTCADEKGYQCVRYLSYHREVTIQRRYAAELLVFLQSRGLLEDTLVVLFSDHGEEFGEHGDEERRRGADPRGYYGAGHGHALYDEILRVPLLVWSPGERPRHDPSPVSLVDIAPTARQRLGLAPGRRLDGRPLPVGRGSSAERALFASGIAYGPEQAAIVVGGRKEIAISCPEQTLLFDERSDPAEKSPARDAAADPALAASLVRYLAQRSTRLVPMQIASSRLKALRSLGYLRGPVAAGVRGSGAAEPTTIGVYEPETATFYLRLANTPGKPDRVVPFGKPGDLPVVGDWDGDGKTDLGVYRPSERTFYVESPDGGKQRIAATEARGVAETPRAGDWDGDGIDTVALYHPDRRTLDWTVADRPGSEWRVIRGGEPGSLAVPGKWRCSGRSALAFFRRDRGIFHFDEPNVAAADVPFGRPGDLPVAGDWNGDGTVTIGVYRPATSTFLLRNSLSPGPPDLVVPFGPPGSIPVVGRWARNARPPRVPGAAVGRPATFGN